MTARSSIGTHAPYSLALNSLTFTDTAHGVIATQHGVLVAWIQAGFHHGFLNQHPHTCHFVEVVYRRKTTYGLNLETFDAPSIEQAKDTLTALFATMTQYTTKPRNPKRLSTLLPLNWVAAAQGGVE